MASGDELKRILRKILGHSGVLVVVAIVIGAGAMALLFVIFDGLFDDPRPGSEAVSELADSDQAALADGEVFPIQIRSIPAPFISPEDGSVLGYVFLDVTLEVAGSEARQRAKEVLDGLVMNFTEQVSENGVGMPSRPGVVDYDRLARMFMNLAQAEIGVPGIARVVIQASEQG